MTPVIAPFLNSIENDESLNLSWTSIPDAEWYSVIVQDDDGTIVEMYNGSDNFTTLTELSIGQNRLRVNVMVDDKISEYSSSEFVTVEEIDNQEEGLLPSLSAGSIILILLVSSLTLTFWRKENDV
jgi:hypothetical protein